jgi:drug/metabolite transporter (DMT)-like permease
VPGALARFAGELAALAAAGLWAVATELYARLGRRIPPLELNLVKNVLAAAMIAAFLAAGGRILAAVPREALGLLLVSGAVGIGLGDTAYFASLGHLGCLASWPRPWRPCSPWRPCARSCRPAPGWASSPPWPA